MAIRDDYDFSIIENTIKESVIDTLEIELKNREDSIVKREDNVIDIVCYALNRLKPKYSASLLGSIYSKADADKQQEEISNVVNEAIDFVVENSGE